MTGEARGISPKRSVLLSTRVFLFVARDDETRHRRSPRLSLHTLTHHSAQVCETLDVGSPARHVRLYTAGFSSRSPPKRFTCARKSSPG